MNTVSEAENIILRPENRPFYFPAEYPHSLCGKNTDNVRTGEGLYPFPRVPLTFPCRNTSPDTEKLLNIPGVPCWNSR
ncbi:hypothetical protein QUF80_04240 [Desulfococcaceae bacterium HSG8]|nr:hypothetical protein [Desulfococcaceae bacterium HSG8]